MQFLPFEYTDLEYLAEMQPPGWGDITDITRQRLASSFCADYKVEVDGKLAGCGAITFNGATAWLCGIIVHPQYRNRGIGTFITRMLIDSIDRSRYPTILLDATDLGYAVYKKLGFEMISEHIHFEGELSHPDTEVSPAIKPFNKIYTGRVLALDKLATGEDRSATLLEKIDESFVYAVGSSVQGFYMPTLMKGLIVAENTITGFALMQLRLKDKNSCMVPIGNKEAIGFLKRQGFTQTRTSKRMRLGPPVPWQPSLIYNVTGGALG